MTRLHSSLIDLPFWKMCPGGNTTILITKPELSHSQHAAVAAKLMDSLHLYAEQVGYVNPHTTPPRIDMMGGEFCGNACRSFAAQLVLMGAPYEGVLNSSGVELPIEYRVERKSDGLHASIRMPLKEHPQSIPSHIPAYAKGAWIIHLQGISHLLLDIADHPLPEEAARKAYAHRILSEHHLLEQAAAGCIWYTHTSSETSIVPFVYVRDTNTLHAETACGSGSLALALHLATLYKKAEANRVPASAINELSSTTTAHEPSRTTCTPIVTTYAYSSTEQEPNNANNPQGQQKLRFTIKQPSGLAITASYHYEVNKTPQAWIGGVVHCIAHGTAFVSL